MVIRIEIPDSLAKKLREVIDNLTLPPERQPDGSIVVRRMFQDIGEMCAHILEVNFRQHIGNVPLDEEDAALEAAMKDIASRRSAKLRPKVSTEPSPPGGRP